MILMRCLVAIIFTVIFLPEALFSDPETADIGLMEPLNISEAPVGTLINRFSLALAGQMRTFGYKTIACQNARHTGIRYILETLIIQFKKKRIFLVGPVMIETIIVLNLYDTRNFAEVFSKRYAFTLKGSDGEYSIAKNAAEVADDIVSEIDPPEK